MIQSSRDSSPWSFKIRVRMLLWEWVWAVFCVWTPKPLNQWRLFWLKLFGARIHGRPFVHQRARVQIPWRLTLHDQSCLGDRANAYSLGEIEVGEGAVVAQEAYLCAGAHDFDQPGLPLVTARIIVGRGAFIGARVFVLPGVTIGERAIVGACSVVSRDVPADTVNAGIPARVLRQRVPPPTPAASPELFPVEKNPT
jgi:putative colanic acid biosynthesis acetyltransferase WcaF